MSLRSMPCIGLCLLLSTAALAAQEPGTVSGNGTVRVQRQPVLMRLTIELSGKGKTIDEALSRLKDRREVAVLKVESLKAAKESIQVGQPAISAAALESQQRFEQILQQRMRMGPIGGRTSKAVKIPESVTVSATLTAEWPLSAASPEELLSSSTQLQKAAKEADLAGLKEPMQLSPEEQELAEEMAEMMSDHGYGSGSEAKPGEPQFVFVARISEEDCRQAMTEAFAKAQASAARVAAAAGKELGELAHLQSNPRGAAMIDYYGEEYYGSPYYASRRMQLAGKEPSDDESIAPLPGPVDFVFSIEASFRLK